MNLVESSYSRRARSTASGCYGRARRQQGKTHRGCLFVTLSNTTIVAKINENTILTAWTTYCALTRAALTGNPSVWIPLCVGGLCSGFGRIYFCQWKASLAFFETERGLQKIIVVPIQKGHVWAFRANERKSLYIGNIIRSILTELS